MTMARSSIKSSRSMDNGIGSMNERRSSPCRSTNSASSSFRMVNRRGREDRMSSRSAITSFSSSCSSCTLETSRTAQLIQTSLCYGLGLGFAEIKRRNAGHASSPRKTLELLSAGTCFTDCNNIVNPVLGFHQSLENVSVLWPCSGQSLHGVQPRFLDGTHRCESLSEGPKTGRPSRIPIMLAE